MGIAHLLDRLNPMLMWSRQDECNLFERNADSIGGAPGDTAITLRRFRLDLECEIVGNSDRTCDLQASTRLRQIAHDAVNCARGAKNN